MGAIDLLDQLPDDFRARGIGKFGKLPDVLISRAPGAYTLARRADENGPLDRRIDVDQVLADGNLLSRGSS
jgi:hypothetical protein